MRLIAFMMTLFLGVYAASFLYTAPCNDTAGYWSRPIAASNAITLPVGSIIKFDTSQNYSLAEAQALVGKRVRNLRGSAKCPKEAGDCLSLRLGEMGEVVSVLPSIENTYLIEIQWEESPQDYAPRYSGRVINGVSQKGVVEVDYSPLVKGAFVTRAGKEVSFEIID